jgi:hypothetical protein
MEKSSSFYLCNGHHFFREYNVMLNKQIHQY